MVIISNSQQLLQSIGNGDSLALNGSNQLTKMSGFQKFIQGFCDIFTSQKNIQARQVRVQNAMVSMLVDARLETMGIRPQGPVNLEKPQSQSREIQTAIQDAQYAINSTRLEAEAFKLTQNPTQAKVLVAIYLSNLNGSSNLHINPELKGMVAKKDPYCFGKELKAYLTEVKSQTGQKIVKTLAQPIDTQKLNDKIIDELKYFYNSKNNNKFASLENGINTGMKGDLDRAPYRINNEVPKGINDEKRQEDGMEKMIKLCPNRSERIAVSLLANQSSSIAVYRAVDSLALKNDENDSIGADYIQNIPGFDISRNKDGDIVLKVNVDIRYTTCLPDINNGDAFSSSMRKYSATITFPHAQFETLAEGAMPTFNVKVE